MSRARRIAAVPGLAAGLAFVLANTNALAAEDSGSDWFLVKAPTGQDSKKPAEVIYAKDDGSSSTLTNAAVLWKKDVTPTGSTVATSLGASLGFSKNTLSKKRSELLTAGGNFQSIIAVSSSLKDNVFVNGDILLEDDREHHARGQAAVLDATLVSASWLHLDPNLEKGKRESGLDGWLYPSLGLFKRRVSSTSSPTDTPVGSHGGFYGGLRVTARMMSLGKDLALIDRFSVEASYVHARESSVSGGYGKATYRYGEVSVNYLLYGEPDGKGWRPMLGFTRSKGTNRVSNEPHVNQSQVSFKVSRGI